MCITVYRYSTDREGYYHYNFNVRGLKERQIQQYFFTPLENNRYKYRHDDDIGKIKAYSMAHTAFKELFGHLNPRLVDMKGHAQSIRDCSS